MSNISKTRLGQLKQLEAQSIHIMREVVAEFNNPTMLYFIGKDSSIMLHLAKKAFYPAPQPYKLLGRKRPSFKTTQAAGHVLRSHSLL